MGWQQWRRRERAAIMDPDHKIKTRNFLVTVFRTFDVSNDGRLSRAEVDRVLAALGRRVEPSTVDGIVERFSGDGGEGKEGKKVKGREGIDWLQGDFLKEVAAINVTNVDLIEEFVFTAAFSTFDQDADGYINPIEMKAVLKLFLPLGEVSFKIVKLLSFLAQNHGGTMRI